MEDMVELANELYGRLKASGIRFTERGYPRVPEEMLLHTLPEEIIPFYCRNGATHPKEKTVLCFYSLDKIICRRLHKLDEDIDIYREYMGICGFDLSPCKKWDERLQDFNILLSQLATVYLGLHGVKFFPNFRIGRWASIEAMSVYPSCAVFAVGTLGCARGDISYNVHLLRAKIFSVRPQKLLIYGPLRSPYQEVLDELVDYQVYPDFQKVSRMRRKTA